MFFDGWEDIIRVFIVGTLAYVGLVVMQRVTGKRTLSKMNAFDLIVTVALGSTLATILLSREVSVTEGLTALALLMLLQYIATWLSVHSDFARRSIKSEPKMLFYGGEFLHQAMRRERVVVEEVLQAVRSAGMASLAEIRAVVLETDGTFSVVSADHDESALENVRR